MYIFCNYSLIENDIDITYTCFYFDANFLSVHLFDLDLRSVFMSEKCVRVRVCVRERENLSL